MGIKSKLIGQTEIKHGGDVFHHILKEKPHHLPTIAPEKIRGFTLIEGKFGITGSVILVDYTHDGKKVWAKHRIEVNEEKQSVTYNMLEGNLLELYKSMVITCHVDTIGDDKLVTWTIDYEKIDVDTPHPGTLLNFFLHMVEDIEKHHQPK